LDRVDLFDASFFGISPREAACMDPQQRLLLEVAWEAVEDAGLLPNQLASSRTGVYIGLWSGDYEHYLFNLTRNQELYMAIGGGRASVAGRVSFALNLQGPSLTLDTGCSSSLVAAHLACQSLRSGECSLALAGGVNLILDPSVTLAYSRAGMLSPDGRCKFGDARANGYVRSEGCGVILLKPLAQALADGDRVYALVLGSDANNDGHQGFFVTPSGVGQEALLRAAYQNSGVNPAQVCYLEAHGTGTAVGDPVEIQALGAVLGPGRPADRPCAIGSVKTNIGHTEAAAGVAGLIKAALSLHHGFIPPSLHFANPNPNIPWDTLPLAVQRKLGPLPQWAKPAIAGVNSFGITGTNAHIILQQAETSPVEEISYDAPAPLLLPISAETDEALAAARQKWIHFLSQTPKQLAAGECVPTLAEICHTASARRVHHERRLALVGATREEMLEQLKSADASPNPSPATAVIFIFSGQGPQWHAMGQQLFEEEAVYRGAIEKIREMLATHVGWDLVEELRKDEKDSRLDQTEVAQPSLFALQLALVELWRSRGIEPDAVIGHSIGEVTASVVSGVLTLEDGVRVVAHRGRVMQKATGRGRMAAVGVGAREAEALIAASGKHLSVAAINSPSSVTLSGDSEALEKIVVTLDARSVFARMLKVNYAFHSPELDPYVEEFAAALADLQTRTPRIPIWSTITGREGAAGTFTARHWAMGIRRPVLFGPAVESWLKAHDDSPVTFLEIGPHPVLAASLRECLAGMKMHGTVLASLRRDSDECATMLKALGSLYERGRSVSWNALYPAPRRCVSLPTYPWQGERYWVEASEGTRPAAASAPLAPQNGLWRSHIAASDPEGAHFWETDMSADFPPGVGDHRIQDIVVMPAAGLAALALTATKESIGPGRHSIEAMELHETLVLAEKTARTVQLSLTPTMPGTLHMQFSSRAANSSEAWTLHAEAMILLGPEPTESPTVSLPEFEPEKSLDQKGFYREMAVRGLNYGAGFQTVEEFSRNTHQASARLNLSTGVRWGNDEAAVVAALDACFQALVALSPEKGGLLLPVGFDRLTLPGNLTEGGGMRVYATISETSAGQFRGEAQILDADGRTLVSFEGVRLLGLKSGARLRTEWFHEIDWIPAERPPIPVENEGASRWLILSYDRGLRARLAEALTRRGAECVQARIQKSGPANNGQLTVQPDNAEDFAQLLERVTAREAKPLSGIVHLFSLDVSDETEPSALQSLTCDSLVSLTQALSAERIEARRSLRGARLWIVTRGTQPAGGSVVTTPFAAAAWGLGRVIALEHPALRCSLVDLDPANAAINELADELLGNSVADQVALRAAGRFEARIVRGSRETEATRTTLAIPANRAFRLATTKPGTFDTLEFHVMSRRRPARGEVEIRLLALGLNFRDVLVALGMLPEVAVKFGYDAAGVITAVGEEAGEFAMGDEVIAFGNGTFGSFLTIRAEMVARRPKNLTMEQAGAAPLVFLTAQYALRHLAKIQRGERVLIHAAAGGVGMAAVQIARRSGCEIFGTAGSPPKRDLLRKMGVQHVLDSRTLAFSEEILKLTGARGVDVVLNSLAGEFIPKSLLALAKNGRFIEIGKKGVWSPAQVMELRPTAFYQGFDLVQVGEREPKLIRKMLEEIVTGFESGEIEPLPIEVYPVAETPEAFRTMSKALHVGKIVVAFQTDQKPLRNSANRRASSLTFRDDAAYLVTGGYGSLGMLMAEWLAAHGARHLVLMGRRGPGEETEKRIATLERAGTRVLRAQGNAARAEDVRRVLEQTAQAMPPLRGMFHCAGVLEDGLVLRQNRERFARVFEPKVLGARNLDRLTRGLPIEHFVMFSSWASMWGSPGQSNYSAANACLDALAHARRASGMAAQTISWGAWAGTGMATDFAERLGARGVGALSPAEGFRALEEVIRRQLVHTAVVPFDVEKWCSTLTSTGPARLCELLKTAAADSNAPAGGKTGKEARTDIKQDLAAAAAGRQQARVMETWLRKQAAQVLRVPVSRVDTSKPLRSLGFDSLLSVEFCNRLESNLNLQLPATLIWNYPTIILLRQHLLERMGPTCATPAETTPQSPNGSQRTEETASAAPATDIETLSDDEAARQLERRLKDLEANP
jgi:acyl transferase domain-containing protein/acyl carrier protein